MPVHLIGNEWHENGLEVRWYLETVFEAHIQIDIPDVTSQGRHGRYIRGQQHSSYEFDDAKKKGYWIRNHDPHYPHRLSRTGRRSHFLWGFVVSEQY
jgi:hypothetical protein